jgi:hypothetical protein
MRPKSSFARMLVSQSVKPFHQLIEQIALLSHVLRLALSSSLMRSFNASGCLGVKSAIESARDNAQRNLPALRPGKLPIFVNWWAV